MSLPLIFRTERMTLRRIVETDIDALVQLDSDPEVMRYISGGVPNDRAAYENELMARMLAFRSEPYGYLAAEMEGSFIGWFHLRPSVADESVLELGYRLQRAVWGRGLATEGGLCLVRHAFDTLHWHAVDACCLPENVASARVMQKCGMQAAGSFIHPRLPVEVRRFLISRTAYDAQQRAR